MTVKKPADAMWLSLVKYYQPTEMWLIYIVLRKHRKLQEESKSKNTEILKAIPKEAVSGFGELPYFSPNNEINQLKIDAIFY